MMMMDEACVDGDFLDEPFPKSTYLASRRHTPRAGVEFVKVLDWEDVLETIMVAVGCPSGWSD